jgi:hypothetical protein
VPDLSISFETAAETRQTMSRVTRLLEGGDMLLSCRSFLVLVLLTHAAEDEHWKVDKKRYKMVSVLNPTLSR